MLFSEIYGSYFNVVAAVIAEAVNGNLTDRRLTELVNEKAFLESTLSIPSSLKNGSWPLLKKDMTTVIRHTPTMPLTLLQKRWLKALLQDPRITLFSPDTSGLEDIEPLYKPETFVFLINTQTATHTMTKRILRISKRSCRRSVKNANYGYGSVVSLASVTRIFAFRIAWSILQRMISSG